MSSKSEARRKQKLATAKRKRKEVKTKRNQVNPQRTRISDLSFRTAAMKDDFPRLIPIFHALVQKYRRLDVAIAIGISDLWPANVASPIKHIFAWAVLLGVAEDTPDARPLDSYEDFQTFIAELYSILPSFPMLEDYSPTADWGQTRVALDCDFVPMFCGGSLGHTQDFVESFRITYAGNDQALAHMDLAVAVQSKIIAMVQNLQFSPIPQPESGHIEIPPEDFWLACRSALLHVGSEVSAWRSKTGKLLEIGFDVLQGELTSSGFGNAAYQGQALPFVAISEGDQWIPLSVRSMPGNIIDYWAEKHAGGVHPKTHLKLAEFLTRRLPHTYVGPITLIVGDRLVNDLPVSCLILSQSRVYVVCACDLASNERASQLSSEIYAALSKGQKISFLLPDGRVFQPRRGDAERTAKEIHIILVITQSSTSPLFVATPKKPTKLLSLSDFIAIFDKMETIDELERFWNYADEISSPFASVTDLFASFRDSHEVLVEGAVEPRVLMLNPHWGSTRRFQELSTFWSIAPQRFPDGTDGWHVRESNDGVVRLESRHNAVFGFSTQIGGCTMQFLINITPSLHRDDCRILEMFANLMAERMHRSRDVICDVPFIQKSHIVFNCEVDPSRSIVEGYQSPDPLNEFPRVVQSATLSSMQHNHVVLNICNQSMQAGLREAKDASFEIRCLLETLQRSYEAYSLHLPNELVESIKPLASEPARYYLQVGRRIIDVPDFVDPIVPSTADYKRARKHLAIGMQQLGMSPGRYTLSEAKDSIDAGRNYLRSYIEQRITVLDSRQLIRQCIEQHDALLISERVQLQRLRQSLSHAVDFDRVEAAEEARKEFMLPAQHYRYLLEKVLSKPGDGSQPITNEILRELVGLVDWYKVLASSSDVLHNGVGIGGIEIDDSYIPEIFYSTVSDTAEAEFSRVYATSQLGIDIKEQDEVVGKTAEHLSDTKLRLAFRKDLGFELQHLLGTMKILSQAPRWGLAEESSLSYSATPERISQALIENIEDLSTKEADTIIKFLTLSAPGILRLARKDVDEGEIPYWEHTKRIHRYNIRPLVEDGVELRWGAETTSRALNTWITSVRDGYLPADFDWPHINPIIRDIKESLEKELERRAETIFSRHAPYVIRGIDFYRRFRRENLDNVGDFDVFAYWPETNTLIYAECKYNQPAYSVKDSRRVRDKIFGKHENDKDGHIGKILSRRKFLEQNRLRMLELLQWPSPNNHPPQNIEIYVSRDINYWMVNPPYYVTTQFIRVDMLDTWLTNL